MALDRTDNLSSTASDFELRGNDRFSGQGIEDGRSHFGAFLMGGVVVAGGLLAFLYYDTGNLNERANHDIMGGSISRTDTAAGLPSLRLSQSTTNSDGKR